MLLTSWLKRLIDRSPRRVKPKAPARITQLGLTRLEERVVLNVGPVADVLLEDPLATVEVDDGDLFVRDASGQDDELSITVNGSNYIIESLNGNLIAGSGVTQVDENTVEVAMESVSGQIDIQTLEGEDTLTVDFGGRLDWAPVSYDGGSDGFDSLIVTGADGSRSGYRFVNSSDGSIRISYGMSTADLSFLGVDSISDNSAVVDRLFSFSGAEETITLSDNETAGDGFSLIGSSMAASVTFANPTSSLTIQSANDIGADTINIQGVDSTFDSDLIVNSQSDDTVSFQQDETDIGSGHLSVITGTINVEHQIVSSGGTIELSATEEITVSSTGEIVSHGGYVKLDSGDNGTTTLSGLIDVSDDEPGQFGGRVELLGMHVGLFDQARIDASGVAGGGTVLVGGDFQGSNTAIRNSRITYVGSNTSISASALSHGDGGTVIVWADHTTRFLGQIEAEGGLEGGDGGFVETSAHYLTFTGSVTTRAPHGKTGQLLLDPTDLTINNGADQNVKEDPANTFGPDLAATTVLTWATIDTALDSANVTVTTVASPDNGEDGNITIAAASPDLASGNQLSITAAGAIVVNATVTNTGAGAVVLNAANAVTVGATISLGGSLNVTGSAITLGANVTTTGTQTYNNAVTLSGGDRILTASTVQNVSTIAGGTNGLKIDGIADIDGAITGLSTFEVTGAANIGASVTSSGTQTYTGAVTLGGNVDIDTVGTAAGNILFS
ncbi:MAG: hypothetical protein O2820_21955, partial [Planctomycetota bacterium]|nr:hypothetical protein [Planctomycetota bacterium]MDA1251884.1 hypothetical protein [Planctomycetota bacterium]